MSRALSIGLVAALAAVIYGLRIDGAAGLIIDDGWYIVLAKALAAGEGFRLISSATAQILPTVPPGFPAVLAPIFLLNPSFPDNLVWLKLVSVVAMGGAGIACYVDFTRHREVEPGRSLWLTAIVVLTPSLVFLATSTVMSECVFIAVQMAGLLAVERAVRSDSATVRPAAAAGLLAGAAGLVRVTGMALIGAALLYFLTRRRYRQALVFAAAVAVCLLPWELYARAHQPTLEERVAHGGTIAYPYTQLVAMERPGSRRWISAFDQVSRAGTNILGVVTRDIGAVVVPALYRGGNESGEEVISIGKPGTGSMGGARGTMVISVILTVIIVIGIARARAWLSLPVLLIVMTVAMIGAVGSMTFRYMLPLTPYLVLFLWRGIFHEAAARLAVMSVLGLHLLDHASYLRARAQGASDWLIEADEADAVLSWLNTNAGPGAVAATNPPLVYLRTGRKAVYLINGDKNWETWRHEGIRYLAATQPAELPAKARKAGPDFQSGRRRFWVVEMAKSEDVNLTRNASGR